MAPTIDPRVDAYLTDAADFARPILEAIRSAVHEACPESTEVIKWGVPFFEFKGTLCGISAHKEHVNFVVPKGELIPELQEWVVGSLGQDAWGVGRIASVEDLPTRSVLVAILTQAADLNIRGVKAPKASSKAEPEKLAVPDYLQHAIATNANASREWEDFTPAKRRDYITWLEDAKTETTRNKRLLEAVQWISEGKIRHWKYQK